MQAHEDLNLYIVTPIFNPFQFQSRARLYRRFAPYIEYCGAKLLTVEAAFGDHPFEVTIPDNPWHIQLRTNSVLFHKERMVNLGFNRIHQIAPAAKFLGWFDADVNFARPDWVKATVHALMHHPVVQPFGEAINLDSKEQYMWHCPSTIRAFIEGRGYHQRPPLPHSYIYKGHPGLAWAATSEAITALGGLYDKCAAGSADTIMANAMKGNWDSYLPAPATEGMTRSIGRWARRCDDHIKANLGFVPGAIFHHWHGKSENRGYEKRWSIQYFHDFDPDEDLTMDVQGLYRWRGNKHQLEDDIRLSLGSRNEDEI